MDRTRRLRSILTCYLAPALLVGVAVQQLYLAHAHDLSPWRGGGFGMFASVDRLDHRVLRAYLLTADGAEIGVNPRAVPGISRSWMMARSMPTRSRLGRVAQRLAGRSWILEPAAGDAGRGARYPGTTAEPGAEAGAGASAYQPDGIGDAARARARPHTGGRVDPERIVDVAAVRVEVWRMEFDARRSTARLRKLAETERSEP